MIYILQGSDNYFIEEKLKQLSKQIDAEVVKLDGNSPLFSIQEMLEACYSSSLFGAKNVVLVKDPPFLIKKYDDNQLKALDEYIKQPIFETDLIFYTFEDKFNSKLKAYKNVSSNAEILKYNTLDYKNFNIFVNQEVRKANLNINNEALNLLKEICKRDASLLQRNIDILSNYPELINANVIQKLCTQNDDSDSFELVNAITGKDISKVIYLERKFLGDANTIYGVIGLLASQLRFLYHIAYLQSNGYKAKQIIDELNISDFRYNKACEALGKLNQKQILKLLNDLSNLDIKCKTDNSISDQARFELFILNLLEKKSYASNKTTI